MSATHRAIALTVPDEPSTIFVGIDDTDMPGTPGTNQLARRLAAALPERFEFVIALRHQLLIDDRVPYTSQNGSASLLIRSTARDGIAGLLEALRGEMRAWYVPGSDPGLCVATDVPDAVVEFGRRCQHEVVGQEDAVALARASGVVLEAFGGTGGGVIGALAAVGLLAAGDDGRVVHLAGWQWPDPFSGPQPIDHVLARGVDEVRDFSSGEPVLSGRIDVGKHLRPAYRNARIVMFVEPAGPPAGDAGVPASEWRAVKLT